jgi:hypothetical protein
MRVLIYAIGFAPKIGGEETYVSLLGQDLAIGSIEQKKRILKVNSVA